MPIGRYLFSVCVIGLLAIAGVWALDSENPAVAIEIAARDGQRYATAMPSEHGALAACMSCHRIFAGGPDRSAPSLTGIVGAPVARSAWFGYSPALARKTGNWTRDELDRFLADPTAAVPGAFKTLGPIRDAAARKEILDAQTKI